ncbi:MAG: indolepyruvate oxidoreductase subunit beta [Thermoanaerobacterales bacterium]|nr:indolepyruvate oxidoreductase subunit beta [Bacillota bacterium]MDI6906590.1 indolepyruvate oxidoreductase subunit beta [Thermoanaerobacterales bacterium]
MKIDIIIAGVGGQGNLLASRVLARAALTAGLEVRTSESIGMAQREGPVTSHVRLGRGLSGAIIPDRAADILLGLELAETVRSLPKLKDEGRVVASTVVIRPITVTLGRSRYPAEELLAYLREVVPGALLFDAAETARRAGNVKAANTVLLGALSTLDGVLPFDHEDLLAALVATIPAKLLEVNRHAFALGREEALRVLEHRI